MCADAGGSNGYRPRLWKTELARLADDAGISITVATSRWDSSGTKLSPLFPFRREQGS